MDPKDIRKSYTRRRCLVWTTRLHWRGYLTDMLIAHLSSWHWMGRQNIVTGRGNQWAACVTHHSPSCPDWDPLFVATLGSDWYRGVVIGGHSINAESPHILYFNGGCKKQSTPFRKASRLLIFMSNRTIKSLCNDSHYICGIYCKWLDMTNWKKMFWSFIRSSMSNWWGSNL